MLRPYVCYHSDGSIWKAGKHIFGLCSAWNHATNPAYPMSEEEHKRSFTLARAIRNRMDRLYARENIHYRELSDGSLWPIKNIGC